MAEPFLVGLILIVAGVMLLLLELSTPGFLISVPAMVLIVLGTIALVAPDVWDSWLSVPILVLVSIVTLVVTMKGYEKLAPPDSPAYGTIGALKDKEGHVIKTVEPNSISGKVRIDHREWAATAVDDKRIAVGSKIKVVDAKGVHLEVRELKTPEKSNE